MKKIPYSILYFTTLLVGFIATEMPNNSECVFYFIFLTGIAVFFQNRLFGTRYIGLDRMITQGEIKEDEVYYRGTYYPIESKKNREERYLNLTFNWQKQMAIRGVCVLITVAFAFLIIKSPTLKFTLAGFIQLICILTLIPIASANHKVIPLGLSFLAVCFSSIKSGEPFGVIQFIYVFVLFLTLTELPPFQTKISQKKFSFLKPALIASCIFVTFIFIFDHLVPNIDEPLSTASAQVPLNSSFKNGSVTSKGHAEGGSVKSDETNSGPNANDKSDSLPSSGSGQKSLSSVDRSSQGSSGSEQNGTKENDSLGGQTPSTSTGAGVGQSDSPSTGKGDEKSPKSETSSGAPPKFSFDGLIEKLLKFFKFIAIPLALFLYWVLKSKKNISKKAKTKIPPQIKESLFLELKTIDQIKLSNRENIIRKYNLFLKLMEAAQLAKEPYTPPMDYLYFLNSRFPPNKNSFTVLTSIFSDTLYGNREIPKEDYRTFEVAFKSVFRTFLL